MDSERKVADQAGRGEDDLLGVIADVEKQLASLKTVKAEREEERQKLLDRERAVKEAEAGLAERAKQCAQREADIAANTKLQQQSAVVAEKREADLNSRAATLQEREHRLSENSAAASRERQAMDARASELTEKEKALKSAATELDRERKRMTAEAEAAEKRAAEAQKASEGARAEAAKATEARASSEKRLAQQTAELEKASARASAAEGQVESFKGQVATRDSRITDLSDKLNNATAKFREVSQTLKDQAQMLGQATALEADRKAKEQRIAELEGKLAGAGNAAKESGALRERLEVLQADAKAREHRITELEGKLKGAGSAAKESGALRERLASLEADVKAREQRIAELESKASGAGKSAAKETHALRERIAELQAELKAKPASSGEDAAALKHELEQTLAELATARKKIQSLKAKAEQQQPQQSGGVPEQIGEAIATRWRRLRSMRAMLQEQGNKLRQASEKLRERYGQSGSLDAQRDELAAARASISESKKKLERMMAGQAKGKAASALFHIVGVLAALGGIAWAVAGEIAPATYAARAIIAADNRSIEASQDQLRSWSNSAEALMKDPALVETAADRMKLRGIESLATPGALQERLNADLTHESSVPGQISIELRGAGKAKTQRVLDTYVNALVSQSNSNTERRVDGLPTMIVQTASITDGALADSRPIYALGIFLLGFGAAAVAGMALWKRLASVKIKFENEADQELARENAVWSKPPQAYSKRG